MLDPRTALANRHQLPVRLSPRPVRASVRLLGVLLLVVGYRLLLAVAIAGTVAHALLFWPQSVFVVLLLAAFVLGLYVLGSEQVAR